MLTDYYEYEYDISTLQNNKIAAAAVARSAVKLNTHLCTINMYVRVRTESALPQAPEGKIEVIDSTLGILRVESVDWPFFRTPVASCRKNPKNPEKLCLQSPVSRHGKKRPVPILSVFSHCREEKPCQILCLINSQKPWRNVPKTRCVASRWNQLECSVHVLTSCCLARAIIMPPSS